MIEDTIQNNSSQLTTSSLLHELANHLDAMLAFWDKNEVCIYANNDYYRWFGKTKEEVIGSKLKDLLGPIYLKNLPYIKAALSGERQTFEREITSLDGIQRHSLTSYIPYIFEGEVLGFFVHVTDVTSLKHIEGELREAKKTAMELATHDFLTGLPNRVLLNDRITQALNLTQRSNKLMAIMSLDIDDFKLINDTYGHGVGDEFLIEIANRLTHCLRESDTVTRMGGDEFLILATELLSYHELTSLADRILGSINQPFLTNNETFTPSCSLGVIFLSSQYVEPDALILESDKALYNAKKQGKNRFVIEEYKS